MKHGVSMTTSGVRTGSIIGILTKQYEGKDTEVKPNQMSFGIPWTRWFNGSQITAIVSVLVVD